MRRLAQYLIVLSSLAISSATAHFTPRCHDARISASEVTTERDVKLFVECAAEFLAEVGPAEARRAFNEDVRWKHGATYVFVVEVGTSGVTSRRFVFPPIPSAEGKPRGAPLVDFGTDLYAEIYRALQLSSYCHPTDADRPSGPRFLHNSFLFSSLLTDSGNRSTAAADDLTHCNSPLQGLPSPRTGSGGGSQGA